jgi:hypothetical protein
MRVTTVISGGQTGADRGGLLAATALGIKTGGWVPLGWITETGPDPGLKAFGLIETGSDGYLQRTEFNVRDSDGTVLFGNSNSPGSRAMLRFARHLDKPVFQVPYNAKFSHLWMQDFIPKFRTWLLEKGVKVLNVAGNRESKSPGIQQAVEAFLVKALK